MVSDEIWTFVRELEARIDKLEDEVDDLG